MQTFSLQTGSNGNAYYVEASGTRLLFDAGIPGSHADRRMAVHGRNIRDVDAVIVSHEHTDHISCAGVYQRMFNLPLCLTRTTLNSTRGSLGRLTDIRFFRSGDSLEFGDVTVHTIPTAHDANDGVAFVIECSGRRLGIFSDLGHPFDGLQSALESVDAAYVESNYDPVLLEVGSYPPHIKARIRGQGGHLSNEECASLVKACGHNRPKWISVAHLSEENNRPELAIGAQLEAIGADYPVFLSSRYECSELLEV